MNRTGRIGRSVGPLARLRRENGGAGMITVLITITFVTVLGVALLFMNYINMQMKFSDRKSRANFYQAEAAISEIRAGIQEQVTDAIAGAYTATLVQYSASTDDQDTFAFEFVNRLGNPPAPAQDPPLTISIPAGSRTADGSYDLAVLASYLSAKSHANTTLSGGGRVRADMDTRQVVLKDIGLRYVENGYETNITTDITIKIPDFAYTVADYSLSRLYEFIIVADQQLVNNTPMQTMKVSGNVYAGSVEMGINADLDIQDDSTLISGGDLRLATDASLRVKGTLWGKSILLDGNRSSVGLAGKTYLANDLVLAGERASAVISGTYYGFGNGAAGLASSSVIVSGMQSQLDLESIDYFALAGHSHVSGGGEESGEIPLAGSLSVKSDQTAFLVPDELLRFNGARVANPFVVTDAVANTLDQPGVLSIDRGAAFLKGQSLNDLGVEVIKQRRMLPSAPGYKIVYVFMRFANQDALNGYFEDYFEVNRDAVEDYLALYFEELLISDSLRAVGTTYATDGVDRYALKRGSSPGIDTIARQYALNYGNVISSLTTSASGGAGVTPFHHFVNVAALSGLGSGVVEFTSTTGEVVGLIVPEGYFAGNPTFVISQGDTRWNDVNVIIAMGDVAVARDFTGLIMSHGDIELRESISYSHRADISLTSAAFNAKNALTDRALIEYMNTAGSGSAGNAAAGEISWVLEDLVVCTNWKKD